MTADFTAPPIGDNPLHGFDHDAVAAGQPDRPVAALDTVDGPAPSLLDELRAEVAQAVPTTIVSYIVPMRAGWAASFRAEVEEHVMIRARRQSVVLRGRNDNDTLNNVKLAGILLGHYSVGLAKNGEKVVGTDGQPLSFRHPEFLAMFPGCADVWAAVREFYGREGDLLATHGALLQASGWLDDAQQADLEVSDVRPSPTSR